MPFLFQFQFTSSSFLWMLFCLLLGLGYAFLMYQSTALNTTYNRLLFFLRAIAVATTAFLLFAPMIKFTGKTTEKPLIILAQDNSSSISISQPANFNIRSYSAEIKKIEQQLSQDYDIKALTFGSELKGGLNLAYRDNITDINALFKNINEQYPNRNIGAIVLATDGIYNSGGNPEFEAQNIKAPIYSVALGDTTAKKDLLITNVNYNNVVYLDNDFQVEVSLEAFQSAGAVSRLTVADAGGTVYSKGITVNSNSFNLSVPITLSAKKKGIQRFTVDLQPIAGELSARNNRQTFFVEVIDGKNKVVILANSPHPDISALKQAIEVNRNYQVKSLLIANYKPADIVDAGLLILHQLPSSSADIRALIQQWKEKPLWIIVGAQTNLPAFSSMQDLLSISNTGRSEEATSSFSPTFFDFTLSDKARNSLTGYAPLTVPFGDYSIKSQSSVLLRQQLGKLTTDKPLLIFSKDSPKKVAVLAGEGIWRWRLEDFKETGSHAVVDELLTKIIQFMVSKDDRRKFRVYPAKSTFDESEHIILNAELYNDNYELINTPEVSVTLKHQNKKSYNFLFTRAGNSYTLDAGVLPAGDYTFTAQTRLGERRHLATGKFAVLQQQAEYRQTTANHQLLFNLSALNNGEVIYPSQLNTLIEKIRKNELIKTVAYEDRKYEELINLKLIFFMILILLSLEWFLRKRNGQV